MTIYELFNEEKCVFAVPPEEPELSDAFWVQFERRRDGGPERAAPWTPPLVEVVTEGDNGRPLRRADVYGAADYIVVPLRTLPRLRPLLEPYGEFLPLRCETEELVLYNVTNVVDALDWDASEFQYCVRGEPWAAKTFVFRPEALVGQHIFRMPYFKGDSIYVSDAVVEQWNALGLTGADFVPRWSSETGPIPDSRPFFLEDVPSADAPLPAEDAEEEEDGEPFLLSGVGPLGDDIAHHAAGVPDTTEERLDEVRAIRQRVDQLRSRPAPLTEGEIIAAVLELGTRYGALLARELGWSFGETDEAGITVLSPDCGYVVSSGWMVRELLEVPEAPNTLVLLFNMLREGQLPPPEEGQTVLIE